MESSKTRNYSHEVPNARVIKGLQGLDTDFILMKAGIPSVSTSMQEKYTELSEV